jgi:FAD/FMN-containing dehydrogenase
VADAVVLPGDAEEVRRVLAWCYQRELAIIPRGGDTGYAGGAVPVHGGVVVSLERLARVRSLEPHWWRAEVDAGLSTANVSRLARAHPAARPGRIGRGLTARQSARTLRQRGDLSARVNRQVNKQKPASSRVAGGGGA